ncbi:PLD-like domain protein (macronuclear) [Tetrahymena thermophila SB210]|uniref:Mitochondrial cardiolipin hydrolase n=1 Tax=Tetrahymena thermophila (strain SB210) TaxID=312017 RepID=Q225Q9_TETTS|nr:PLD-like domain protein [Tetrahymena thermophila SB210]XP_012653702.1 PLD-like domain protein [Tetrahymena thermophila SB210]EAR81025.1 PLD-like domain protein [Tetrahymena thermophila SB210]EWS73771.1 PLD-like domain protein [Tetrahymena thermophila SB210]|eukprot:XP_001028688.1 PLD-like domain protein [Tetrahymena thermophila SB210]
MDKLEDQTCREDFRASYKNLEINEANKKNFVALTKKHIDEISRVDICNLIDELRTGDSQQDKKVDAVKDALFHLLGEVTIRKPSFLDALFFPQDDESRIVEYLNLAHKTIDVCVFTISNDYLAWALYDLHKKGVKVRIITDDECSTNRGSDIQDLADAGIPCRLDSDPTAHMHNKFAIIDGHILVNGSFNWTQQAVEKNQENLSIIDSEELCQKYTKEYEKLWAKFEHEQVKKVSDSDPYATKRRPNFREYQKRNKNPNAKNWK